MRCRESSLLAAIGLAAVALLAQAPASSLAAGRFT
jgi:hypothetical protein